MNKATNKNCTVITGHCFEVIKSERLKQIIRHTFPEFDLCLWKCKHCGCVTEST